MTDFDQTASELYDASDAEQVERQRQKAADREAEGLLALAEALKKPAIQRWFWGKLTACHMFETSFVQGDQNATAFREGERNIGLMLLSDFTAAAPDIFMKMMKRNKTHG